MADEQITHDETDWQVMKWLREAIHAHQSGELEEAEKKYNQILAINPDHADCLYFKGVIRYYQVKYDEAEVLISRAIEINPGIADYYVDLGNVYKDKHDLEGALSNFRMATMLNPEQAEIHFNIGYIFSLQSRWDNAIQSYQQAITLKPELQQAYNKLGEVLLEKGKPELAESCFNTAIEMNSTDFDAINNLGRTYALMGDYVQSIQYYDKALDINPYDADAHTNKGYDLLKLGQLVKGWPEIEWRFRKKKPTDKRFFPKERWKDHAIFQKRLLVTTESNLEDIIQFIRFLPKLKSLGCYLMLECPVPLHALLAPLDFIDELVSYNLNVIPDVSYDYYMPLMSIPGHFKMDIEAIKKVDMPYLEIRQDKVVEIQPLVSSECFKIGFIWSGHQPQSPPLSCFSEIATLKGVALYAVLDQHARKSNRKSQTYLHDLSSSINTIDDTVAFVMNMDLIIAIDSVAVHIAGALNKPAWLILPEVSNWRWFLNQNDSPWYPSIRLFHQSQSGEWRSMGRQVFKALKQMMNEQQGNED